MWQVLDLFWLCHSRVAGFSGWSLQRTGNPKPGSALQQDHWTMSMFQIIENEFNMVQSENAEESRHARDLQKMHNQVVSEANKK